ncbi:hypothetical protein M231_03232 [Tremella mesenterica]|uniref:Uncharacterized protein n=1 Tax=Tremella mesenterica TaxID=5217 RepID=A0A4Q1BP71_TREME|nr:hypothetical protein M231_03232 [Tremella mesenterica]
MRHASVKTPIFPAFEFAGILRQPRVGSLSKGAFPSHRRRPLPSTTTTHIRDSAMGSGVSCMSEPPWDGSGRVVFTIVHNGKSHDIHWEQAREQNQPNICHITIGWELEKPQEADAVRIFDMFHSDQLLGSCQVLKVTLRVIVDGYSDQSLLQLPGYRNLHAARLADMMQVNLRLITGALHAAHVRLFDRLGPGNITRPRLSQPAAAYVQLRPLDHFPKLPFLSRYGL